MSINRVSISSAWLKEHGVEGNEDTLKDVAGHAKAALALKIREALIDKLDDEQFKEFEQLSGKSVNETVRLKWLERHCADYRTTINNVTAGFLHDIASSEYPITYILGQSTPNN